MLKELTLEELFLLNKDAHEFEVDLLSKDKLYYRCDWDIVNDNCVHHFGYNFYHRTPSATDPEYNPSSIKRALNSIQKTLSAYGAKIVRIYVSDKYFVEVKE